MNDFLDEIEGFSPLGDHLSALMWACTSIGCVLKRFMTGSQTQPIDSAAKMVYNLNVEHAFWLPLVCPAGRLLYTAI